jgi:putative OPT family oligopeptide transporter
MRCEASRTAFWQDSPLLGLHAKRYRARVAERQPFEITDPASAETLQLTLRATLTGMLLGALLSLCNIYTGLKIGWGTNMSITAGLLGYGFWLIWQKAARRPQFGILENCMSQTTASAAASIASAGLVAPIPALTMLTGRQLAWHWLALWVFAVACVGVLVAVSLRRQMLITDRLPFPYGIATGETLREMYARGREALARVGALLAGGALAAGLKTAHELFKLEMLGIPGRLGLSNAALASKNVGAVSLKNLGFGLEPGLLFFGVGALIGTRAGISLLIGAVAGWGVLAPYVLEQGWAEPDLAKDQWVGPVLKWLLWPGVAMMVTASLTSFAFSGRSILAALREARKAAAQKKPESVEDVSRAWIVRGLAFVLVLTTFCQVFLFGIVWWVAVLAVLLTFVLAIVAGRVAGETGITPVGPMGKVTQLVFGVIAPADPTANLMSANVTGGAASQVGDMLHDFRTGHMLGAWPRLQATAQSFGVLSGALAGAAAYLIIVPDPANMLLTKEWPAPAVAQWKAVAELFQKGFSSMPPGATTAIAIAGTLGIALALAEKLSPERIRRYLPSASSMGLALVVPAHYSIAMFAGAVMGWASFKLFKSWSARFVVVIASGVIAGESLAGVGFAIKKILSG